MTFRNHQQFAPFYTGIAPGRSHKTDLHNRARINDLDAGGIIPFAIRK
jgi:hypothetical protein